MLRRPHDHHRDLRARRLAAPPSDGTHGRDQDRHLVTTTPGPRRRKAARLLSWFSTGHHHARTDMPSMPLLPRQSSPDDPAMPLECGSLVPANLVDRRHRPRRPLSVYRSVTVTPAARSRHPPHRPNSRFPPVEVFGRRPSECAAPSVMGRGIRGTGVTETEYPASIARISPASRRRT